MGIHMELQNFDELFYQYSSKSPIIVNTIQEISEDDKESFNKVIYTKYTSDLLRNLPSCECGEVVGEYNHGVVCPNCCTPVQSHIEQDLEPLVWIKAPIGVNALINPVVWTMLKERFERSRFEIIRWICDTSYNPQNIRVPAIMEKIQGLQIERGYNNFVANFDAIMEALFSLNELRPKKGEVDPLQLLIAQYRNCIFSDYLPLPNKALLVIEENNLGTYADSIITGAIDAIRTLVGIDNEINTYSTRVKENRVVKTISKLAEYYDELAKTTLAKKEGIFRKHIVGTRSHFSFRAVISSLTDAHRYDELHIPWGIGISVFKIHLINKLIRRGYTPNSAVDFLNAHAARYHPLLDEMFNMLINESPYGRIPVIWQRNPSLERASAQAMWITKVKTDPDIPTVSMSILSVKGFNAKNLIGLFSSNTEVKIYRIAGKSC